MSQVFSELANQERAPFVLPKLPYTKDEFLPLLSQENFDYHYNKHHNAYVVKLNQLLENQSNLSNLGLEEIIKKSSGDEKLKAIFNNAAQIWNHSFYWHSISPNGGGGPQEGLQSKINETFGNQKSFLESFVNAGVGQFGSGWVWLVLEQGNLKIKATSNAETPITSGDIPLLVCDVWEHAYYIDYRNARSDYLKIFMSKLVNWKFAEDNYNRAKPR